MKIEDVDRSDTGEYLLRVDGEWIVVGTLDALQAFSDDPAWPERLQDLLHTLYPNTD